MKCTVNQSRGWLGLGVILSSVAACTMLIGGAPAGSPSGIDWNTSGEDVRSVQLVSVADSVTNDSASKRHAYSLSAAFREASSAVMPSVVTIQSLPGDMRQTSGSSSNEMEIPEEFRNNPMLRRFFEGLPQGRLRVPQPRGKSGSGSGVIVDRSGVILTNNHVVDGAGKVVVKLHDGREFEATDWKTDPKTDIAIVRIDADDELPPARIGNSDKMLVGDWVLAVGAPFGLKESVTSGIVSAKSRGIGITDREDFIQTDAAINPGNSGGPLVNLDGEVIAINTAISTTSGGYQGIGFAVPINLARWIGDELASNGSVRRSFLGVAIQQVTNTLSKQLDLDAVRGAVVTEVREGTPAHDAGVAAGDVILSFNGRDIRTPRDLQGAVERASLAKAHKMVIIRDGKEMTIEVNVANSPGEVVASSGGNSSTTETSRFEGIGLQLTSLTKDVAAKLNMGSVSGVIITGIKPNSPAEAAGLEETMVISRVGNTNVNSPREFADAMNRVTLDDGILLLVRTPAGSRFIVVRG